MHYEEGSKFACEKHELDSAGNRRRLSLFLIKILILVAWVFNFIIYAIKYDENGVN